MSEGTQARQTPLGIVPATLFCSCLDYCNLASFFPILQIAKSSLVSGRSPFCSIFLSLPGSIPSIKNMKA